MMSDQKLESSLFTLSDGEQVHVLHAGPRTAPCLFFYHSVLTEAELWTAQLARFSKDYFVVALDSRGHGKSAAKQWDGSMDRLVLDVPEVLEKLGVENAHFVGLSLGGIVGYGLAAAQPQCLSSLFVSSARPDGNEAFRQPWPGRAAQARAQGLASLEKETLERWFPRGQETLMRHVGEWVRRTSVDGFEKSAVALQSYDYANWASNWDKPTTLLVGERDGVLPAVMADVAAQGEQTVFVSLPQLGHLPNVEDPDAFNQALAAHLNRTAS